MLSSRRRERPRVTVHPDKKRWLETAMVKRCGVCAFRWEASEVVMEEGVEKCPNCIEHRTEEWKAEVAAKDAEQAARWDESAATPQISQIPLDRTFPGTVVRITDANGNAVRQSSPLRLTRTVAKTLLLIGRDFVAADTITGASGLTISVSARTATLTTLSLTAGAGMAAGDYGITFNDIEFKNLLVVR
jgi:hypothetical protein